MRQSFFWCGNILLLSYLLRDKEPTSIILKLIHECISDRDYTYEVMINNEIYYYHFTLNSNTKCIGSFFIENKHWKSHVYSFTKPYNFIHVNESPIDFHYICSYSSSGYLDTYICGGRKTSITYYSIVEKGSTYHIKTTCLPIKEIQKNHSPRAIRNLFAISGAINQMKLTINDPVSYDGSTLSLISYTDSPSQIIGVESITNFRKSLSAMQCINSFFDQRYEFKQINTLSWNIREYVNSLTNNILKREYNLEISNDKIIIPDKKLTFSYQMDNGDIIFRKI